MLMPWDHDYVYRDVSLDPYSPANYFGFNHHLFVLLDHPPSRDDYTEALLEAYEAYDPDRFAERLDTWSAQIRDSVNEDPTLILWLFDSEVAYIRDFVYQRKSYLDAYWK